MNTRWKVLLVAAVAALLVPAMRAAAAGPNESQQHPANQGPPTVIQTSTLIGATVVDSQGRNKVGQIKDVLLDPQSGQANFAVLDAEIPGAGHAMLVVPYRALTVSSNPTAPRPSVVLDLRPERLHTAPQIQNGRWQALQDPQFLEKARNFYQPMPYTAARPIGEPPSLPSAAVQGTMPPTYILVPAPRADSPMPQNLVDFFNE